LSSKANQQSDDLFCFLMHATAITAVDAGGTPLPENRRYALIVFVKAQSDMDAKISARRVIEANGWAMPEVLDG